MKQAGAALWWPDIEAPVALHLTADLWAEHEWGIRGLTQAFGLPELGSEQVGLERHRIRTLPPELIWYHKSHSRYSFLRYQPFTIALPSVGGRELRIYRSEETAGGWSASAFQVVAQSARTRARLADLRDAFLCLDVAILLSGSNPENPFDRSGLTLGIVSRTPPETRAYLRERDLEYLALRAAADATGVRERIGRLGLGIRSLVPNWADVTRTGLTWYADLSTPELRVGWHRTEALLWWLDAYEAGAQADTDGGG